MGLWVWSTRQSTRGASLAELLLVLALILILIAVLLPVTSSARRASRAAACLANLKQIGQAAMVYATDNRHLPLPSKSVLGHHGYRVAPGLVSPSGGYNPETFGLAAALNFGDMLRGRDASWVCPAAERWMADVQNSYAFSTNEDELRRFERFRRDHRSNAPRYAWDNTHLLPGYSGRPEQVERLVILDPWKQYYVHSNPDVRARNVLFLDLTARYWEP